MRTCVFVVFILGHPEDGESRNLGLHGISIAHGSTVDFSVFFFCVGRGEVGERCFVFCSINHVYYSFFSSQF